MPPLTMKLTSIGMALLLLIGRSTNSLPSTVHSLFPDLQPASPVITTPTEPASDFALIFEYGDDCGANRLDTFRGDFTQERITEPSITLPITITFSDKISIYQKMVAINFFSYPAFYAIPPAPMAPSLS